MISKPLSGPQPSSTQRTFELQIFFFVVFFDDDNFLGFFNSNFFNSMYFGLVFVQSQDANRLRTQAEQLLNAGQTDSAGPLLRQYLEFMLQQVIRKVDIPVPFDFAVRSDKKQVQNSLDAINEAVDLHERAGDLVLSTKQLSDIKGLHVPAIVGNWLAHYSEGVPMSVTAHVLLSVLDSVDAFADCFKYECRCSGSAQSRYYRNLRSKHCQC